MRYILLPIRHEAALSDRSFLGDQFSVRGGFVFRFTAPWRRKKREFEKSKAEMSDRERQLQTLVAGLSPLDQSDAAQRARMELEEVSRVVRAEVKWEKLLQDEEQRIRQSPEYMFSEGIKKDHRRPTRADLSGIWMSNSKKVIGSGYLLQLEQKGKIITGQVEFSGCTGSTVYPVTGLYEDGVLTLNFSKPYSAPVKCVYRYAPGRWASSICGRRRRQSEPSSIPMNCSPVEGEPSALRRRTHYHACHRTGDFGSLRRSGACSIWRAASTCIPTPLREHRERAIAGVTRGLIGPDEEVTWRARHFGIWQTLTCTNSPSSDRPNRFCRHDAPWRAFRCMWNISDIPEESADGTIIMRDVFAYESPLGILGHIADILFPGALHALIPRRPQSGD